jgi:hypothetical protein
MISNINHRARWICTPITPSNGSVRLRLNGATLRAIPGGDGTALRPDFPKCEPDAQALRRKLMRLTGEARAK